MSDSVDIVIIGGGPGGYVAAQRAGRRGARVLLVEKEHLGGVCLNVGCIPTKTLLHSAKLYQTALHSAVFGVQTQGVTFDPVAAAAWKQKVVTRLRRGVAAQMRQAGVEVVSGTGRLISRTTAELTTADGTRSRSRTIKAGSVILATGSRPVLPRLPGIDGKMVHDSTSILELQELPRRIVIVGGGYIGMEFAAYFHALGVTVTVIEMLPEVVPMVDPEIAAQLRQALPRATFRLATTVGKILPDGVEYRSGEKTGVEAADVVLIAVGRAANVADLGLEEVGVESAGTGIRVDERMRTTVPGVHAVGDVTGKSMLAHAASRMGEVAVNTILGTGAAAGHTDRMRYHAIPWVVYTSPEIAGVGVSRLEAASQGLDVAVASVPMVVSGRYLAEHEEGAGLCRVVADRRTETLIGVQMIGTPASEIIYGAAALIEAQLRIRDIRELVFPHPTVSEVVRDAVWELEL